MYFANVFACVCVCQVAIALQMIKEIKEIHMCNGDDWWQAHIESDKERSKEESTHTYTQAQARIYVFVHNMRHHV